MSEVKQDRRQISLSDEGRSALLIALKQHFPRYPQGVYPESWQDLTKVDRRTVDKMLTAGQKLRQASIETIFLDLGAAFDPDSHIEHGVTVPVEAITELNGVEEDAPTAESVPHVENTPELSRPSSTKGEKRSYVSLIALGVALASIAFSGILYERLKNQHVSAPVIQNPTDSDSSSQDGPNGGMALYDQFKADNALVSSRWTVNGPVSHATLGKFESPAYPVVNPRLVFDKQNGLGLSGMSGNGEQGAIESVRSFTPPFTVSALCNAESIHGDAMRLAISTGDGNRGFSVGFGSVDGSSVNAEDGSFFCTGPAAKGGIWQQIGDPLSALPPATDVWYVLTIAVDASGKATAAVSSGGYPIGTASNTVGKGPFHVLLTQEDGAQGSIGVNQAYCGTIQVINEVEQ